MPKVSVVVTTYNRKEYLTETIQSILNQTFQNFELIVVDNYSNYDFFSIIKNFNSDKIIPFQNQNNGIIAVNRNFGIKHSKGEYIAFCDDDDAWIKEKLQLQISILDNYDADLVYSNTFLVFESGEFHNSNYRPTNTLNRLLFTNHITLSSVILRNNELINFNEDKILTGIEDYDLWLRLITSGFKFEFIQTPLVKYRILNSSYSNLSRSINIKKVIKLRRSFFSKKLTLTNKFILSFSLLISDLRYVFIKTLKR